MLAAFASAHQNNAYALKVIEQGLAEIPDRQRFCYRGEFAGFRRRS